MISGKETGTGGAPGRERNVQARLAGRLAAELRHYADLALFADVQPTRWTDALLAETRFHLAGTMNAIEMAIRLEVSAGDIEVRLVALPQPWSSPALERQIELLTPELIAYYRLRGAASAVQRGRADLAVASEGAALLAESGEGLFGQALAALSLAEQRWAGPMLFDAPLRPDLPAEIFCDLAWTVAALLIRGLAETSQASDRDPTQAVAEAAERVIARHDEGGSPFALARRCARALSSEERLRIVPPVLRECRLLLFCALVAAETALPMETVLGALVDGDDAERHAVMKLMGLDEALAVQLFEMLSPLTGGPAGQDAALVRFVERYRHVDLKQAEAWLEQMLVPAALAAKLSIIDPAA